MRRLVFILPILLFYSSLFSQDSVVVFKVEGKCAMCKMRIEEAGKIRGVSKIQWDMDSRMLSLQYNPEMVTVQKVHKRIAEAGHDTELERSKDHVYKSLPDCCLYRDAGKTSGDDMEISETNEVLGVVMEMDSKGNLKPLGAASVYQSGTKNGTVANENGFFRLVLTNEESILEISFAGYQSQQVKVKGGQHLTIVLNAQKELQEVKIVAARKASYIPFSTTIRTLEMTEKELFKAACCNLSESFETNPSVDVTFSDAVTGSKQIQLLGLSGNYSQLTIENLPGPRGLATPWGLNSIPGTWVESIQMTKGVGSVVNGFESITGQVNVELKKPENTDKLYANVYVNNMGKTDLNLNLSRKLGNRWSTALLLHDAFLTNSQVDFNKDGFRDLPTGNLFTFMNRWKYDDGNGLISQFGYRYLRDNKVGGETAFDEDKHKLTSTFYGAGLQTVRHDGFAKIGYIFPEKRFKSLGLQLSAFRYNQDSYFGLTEYTALQKNLYANLIYQSIIGNTNHKFRTGLSFISDQYNEHYRSQSYRRSEQVPGVFFEYSFTHSEKLDLIAGIRADHNNLFGFFMTPRLHLRYQPQTGTVIRIGAGRGQRTANIFAENTTVLVSSRQVNILNGMPGRAYGLNPEIAWSEGVGLDQRFRLFGKKGTIGLDYFRTDFQNQVIVDLDKSAREVNFYDLIGKSFANSFQVEVNYEIIRKLDLRLAYRLFDVKSTYHGRMLERPLISKHRGFANLSYEHRGWKFDYTLTFNGTKRIPYTGDNPLAFRMDARSPSFMIMNAQVTKTFGNKHPFDFYIGGENIGNYFQQEVILSANDPFGTYFDASLIWGPVSGRMIYGGIRYKIK